MNNNRIKGKETINCKHRMRDTLVMVLWLQSIVDGHECKRWVAAEIKKDHMKGIRMGEIAFCVTCVFTFDEVRKKRIKQVRSKTEKRLSNKVRCVRQLKVFSSVCRRHFDDHF